MDHGLHLVRLKSVHQGERRHVLFVHVLVVGISFVTLFGQRLAVGGRKKQGDNGGYNIHWIRHPYFLVVVA